MHYTEEMVRMLNFKMSGKLLMGYDAIQELPAQVKALEGTKPLLVTDPGLVKAGICSKVELLLKENQIQYTLYSEVEADPRIEVVFSALELAKSNQCDLVIGLGGGSSLDIGKMVAVMMRNDAPIANLIGIGNIPKPGLPTIMIPTTAGTGSEVTPIVVLSDKAEQLKKGVVSDFLYPDVALVDPLLMVSLPSFITAYTGIDALTHAIEAYTNKFAQPFIDTFALKAIELISRNLPEAVKNGTNEEARYNMALGSLYGGMCLGAVNTAAVHALAYPLGGMFDVPHGVANSLLLPYVIEFNLESNLEKYARIAEALGEDISGLTNIEAGYLCIKRVTLSGSWYHSEDQPARYT